MNFLQYFSRLFAVLSCLWLAAYASPVRAQDAAAAGAYVDRLGEQALSVIKSTSLSKTAKQAALEKLFVENVDFQWVGRFVMGRFWRQASDAQKARYLKEYQKFLTLHYTSRFTDYTGGTFKITDTRDEGGGEYIVSTQMGTADPGSEQVFVDYKVRREGAGFKIFDVIVEGVSLITTQRSEFSSVISQHGIDYLIDMLARKSQTGQVSASAAKAR